MKGAYIGFSIGNDTKSKLLKLNVPKSIEQLPPYHVTLLYLGKTADIEPNTRLNIVKACADVCASFSAFAVRVGGFGVFINPGEPAVVHAIVDSPVLCDMRTALKKAIARVYPLKEDHGFNPHITLTYTNPRGVTFPINSVSNAVQFKPWRVNSMHIMFSETKVRIPLTALPDIQKSVSIPLYKSRKKGSTNKHHMYLMRLVMPDGTYRYVRPDENQVESYDPKTGFVFKNGQTTKDVINTKLFGSYGVVRKKDKSGIEVDHEFVVPGMLYDYEARRTTPKYVKQYGVPVNEDTVGKIRFFKYRRIPGFVSYDLAPGVDYVMPKRGLDMQLDAKEAAEARQAMQPAAEGAKPLSDEDFENTVINRPENPATSDANPLGEFNIHRVAKQSAKTEQVLREPLAHNVDPLVYSTGLADKVRVKAEAFPDYAVDKYESEQNLLDALQQRPATTLVTLGHYDPKSAKTQAMLKDEWYGVIRGLARNAFDAYKVGDYYNRLRIQDTAQGRTDNSPTSLVRQYRRECMSDLIQQGFLELYASADAYIPTRHSDDRFDKYAYEEIKNALYAHSLENVRNSGGSFEPIVSDADAEAIVRKQGQGITQVELSPEEVADLHSTQREAKKVILTFMHSSKFPETLRKVFMSRLWLDDESKEQEKIEHRASIGQADVKNFERPYTGPDSIAEKYGKLKDPKSGKVIDFRKLSPQAATYYLAKWYNEAQELLANHVSKPVPSIDEEDAIGKRTLTGAGKAVKRWLTLKTALLSSNKRLPPVDRYQHPVVLADLTKPYVPSSRVVVVPATSNASNMQEASPAVLFWQHNKQLAARLGLKIPEDSTGIYNTPNVSLGTKLSSELGAMEKYHKHYLGLSDKTDKDLAKQLEKTKESIRSLRKIGVTHDVHSGEVNLAHGLLHDFHDAMLKHTSVNKRIAQKMSEGNQAMSELRSRGTRVTISKVNPFNAKKDAIAHEAHNSLSAANASTHIQTDGVLADYLNANFAFKNKSVFTKTHAALKEHLIKNGSVVPAVTDADIKKVKDTYAVTPKETSELNNAKERAASLGSTLAATGQLGTALVKQYMQHAVDGTLDNNVLSTASNTVLSTARDLANRYALGMHEKERRKVNKSDVSVHTLFKAFALYTYTSNKLQQKSLVVA